MGIRFQLLPKRGRHVHQFPDGRRQTVLAIPGEDIIEVECKEELGGALFKFKQLDPDPPEPRPSRGLRMRHRAGGWYDVINEASGLAINDKALKKEEAQALILESESAHDSTDSPGENPSVDSTGE